MEVFCYNDKQKRPIGIKFIARTFEEQCIISQMIDALEMRHCFAILDKDSGDVLAGFRFQTIEKE